MERKSLEIPPLPPFIKAGRGGGSFMARGMGKMKRGSIPFFAWETTFGGSATYYTLSWGDFSVFSAAPLTPSDFDNLAGLQAAYGLPDPLPTCGKTIQVHLYGP